MTIRRASATSPNKFTSNALMRTRQLRKKATKLAETVQGRMKKFDICYVIAKESMAFRKYPALHALHGVDLGFAYKTTDSAISL